MRWPEMTALTAIKMYIFVKKHCSNQVGMIIPNTVIGSAAFFSTNPYSMENYIQANSESAFTSDVFANNISFYNFNKSYNQACLNNTMMTY